MVKTTKYLLVLLYIFSLSKLSYGQKIPKELLERLKTAKSDSEKVVTYLKIGDVFQYTNIDSALYYYRKAQKIAEKCKCKRLVIVSLNYQAIVLMNNGKYPLAYKKLDSALSLNPDSVFRMYLLNNLAAIYIHNSMYTKAFEIFKQELAFYLKRKDSVGITATYSNLASLYQKTGQIDTALWYNAKAIEINKKLKDTLRLVITYFNRGLYYKLKHNYNLAKKFLYQALSLAKKASISYVFPVIYNELASLYLSENKKDSAFIFFNRSISLNKQLNNYEALINIYIQLADVFLTQDSPEKAKIYIDSTINVMQKYPSLLSSEDKQNLYETMYKYYKVTGHFDSALYYHEKFKQLSDSLKIDLELKKIRILELQLDAQNAKRLLLEYQLKAEHRSRLLTIHIFVSILSFIILLLVGYYAYKLNKIKKLLQIKNIRLQRLLKRDKIQISLYNIMRFALTNIDQLSTEIFIQKLLEKILEIDWINIQHRGAIYLLHQSTGNLKLVSQVNLQSLSEKCKTIEPGYCLCGLVLKNQKEFISNKITDSHQSHSFNEPHGHFIAPLKVGNKIIGILNLYLRPNIKLTDEEYEFLHQLILMLSLMIDHKIQTVRLKIEKLKVEKTSEQLQKQSKKLKATLKDLNDSITFASYMIESLLPSKEQLDSLFKDYFLIFKPLNKLGGDFYFASQLENKIYLAIGDATGHGIPGAILAAQILGYFYEFIVQHKICEPKEILAALREKIKISYSKSSHEAIRTSGADIGVCVIDKTTSTMKFAGANIPLYLVRDNKLYIYKRTRSPVGLYVREVSFDQYTIELKPGDMIYLQSDGFVDQLNESLHKFTRRRYEMLLTEISSFPVKIQKKVLLEAFNRWRGTRKQTDDIVILGFRWTKN